MTIAIRTAAAVALLAGASAAGLAASAVDDAAGRYSMSPTDGGFVRLDRQTGAMTFCTKGDAAKPETAWSCTPMGDTQQLTDTERDRLEAENKALKADKQHLEEMLGMADPSKPGAVNPDTGSVAPKLKIPSEQDVDQAFDYLEGMMKKFRERMKKLDDVPNKEEQL